MLAFLLSNSQTKGNWIKLVSVIVHADKMRGIHWTYGDTTRVWLEQNICSKWVEYHFFAKKYIEPCSVHFWELFFYSLYNSIFTCCSKQKANKLKWTVLILRTTCNEYGIVFFFISIRIAEFVNSMCILIDLSFWCVHAYTVLNDSLTETWNVAIECFFWIFKRLKTVHIE